MTSNSKFKGHQLEVPCTINNVRVMGLLDTGVTVSVIDKSLAEDQKWVIQSQLGHMTQAFERRPLPRIEVVQHMLLYK